jgi:hypothetical protein
MIPITGAPLPHVATNAVGMPATPSSTRKPAAFNSSRSTAALFVSL